MIVADENVRRFILVPQKINHLQSGDVLPNEGKALGFHPGNSDSRLEKQLLEAITIMITQVCQQLSA